MTLHVDLLYYWILGLMVLVFGGAFLAWAYYKTVGALGYDDELTRRSKA